MPVPTVLIAGIDPGTRVTGWGIISACGDDVRAVAHGVIAPPVRWPIDQRLVQIFDELRSVIAGHAPAAVAIEEPFVGANVRSAMAVGEARTVAMLAAALAGVRVFHYPPARVKQAVAGYGLGDKTQVREMLRVQLQMAEAPADLNASDALAIALCHALRAKADALIAAGR